MPRALQRDPLPSAAACRRARAAGFTLIELLVVLSIMGILMGISIGAFKHAIPAQSLARNAVIDSLRQARLYAMQENGTAFVRLEAAPGEAPTVTAVGKRTVGTWHLEGEDLEGFPQAGQGEGFTEEANGAVGKAVRLQSTGASWIDFGVSPSFDSPFGAACELFLEFDAPRNEPILSKGKGFVLKSESDGSLKLTVRVRDKDEHGDPRDTFRTVDTGRPVLVPGRFAKVAASFDGMQLRLAVDDEVVAESMLVKPLPFAFDGEAPLVLGGYDQALGAAVDELKWSVFDGHVQELRGMALKDPLYVVRFAPDGTLDPQFHQQPVEIGLHGEMKDPEQPAIESWVRVGALGDLH